MQSRHKKAQAQVLDMLMTSQSSSSTYDIISMDRGTEFLVCMVTLIQHKTAMAAAHLSTGSVVYLYPYTRTTARPRNSKNWCSRGLQGHHGTLTYRGD